MVLEIDRRRVPWVCPPGEGATERLVCRRGEGDDEGLVGSDGSEVAVAVVVFEADRRCAPGVCWCRCGTSPLPLPEVVLASGLQRE